MEGGAMTAGPDDLEMIFDLGADIAKRIRASGASLDQQRESLVLLSRLRRRLMRSKLEVPEEVDLVLFEALEADVISGVEI
jgi:hypothetical protein